MLKGISVVRLCSSQREEVMAAIGSRDLWTVAEISSVRGTRTVGAVQGGVFHEPKAGDPAPLEIGEAGFGFEELVWWLR